MHRVVAPEQRSWLDAWWSRFLLAPGFIVAGILFVVTSVNEVHPSLRGTLVGGTAALLGLVLLLVGPRRLDTWIRRYDDRHR